MIHSFEIHAKEKALFIRFMANQDMVAEGDYKLLPSQTVDQVRWHRDFATKAVYYEKTMDVLVLFRNRLDCEYTEFTWHMFKDELRRNQVAMAA
jgi:hypothetical protein